MVERNAPVLRTRSVFISDIHLGFKGCSADLLLDFLHHVEMDYLFLVGDIIDVWSMKKTMYWPPSAQQRAAHDFGQSRSGARKSFSCPATTMKSSAISTVPSSETSRSTGNTSISRADGRRMLVLHGDEFDSVVKFSPWLAKLGRQHLRCAARRESLHQLGPSEVRSPALVLVVVSQEQGEEGRAVHRQLRRGGRAGRRQAARSTPSSAATFIVPRCARSTAFSIATTGDWVESCTSPRRRHERSSAPHRLAEVAGTNGHCAGRSSRGTGGVI